MKKNYDEPIYKDKQSGNIADENKQNEIKEILLNESFAVLATQGDGKPFSSLISHAFSEDFKRIIFATPLSTRKFDLISKNNKVSILIDTRSTNHESINEISAITLVGDAKIVENDAEQLACEAILLKTHPYLEAFVKTSTTKIISVDIETYFYVRKFQEVIEWNPNL